MHVLLARRILSEGRQGRHPLFALLRPHMRHKVTLSPQLRLLSSQFSYMPWHLRSVQALCSLQACCDLHR